MFVFEKVNIFVKLVRFVFVFERRAFAFRPSASLSLCLMTVVLLFPPEFGEHAGALDGRRTDGYVGILPFG